jgi:hypothetical protein
MGKNSFSKLTVLLLIVVLVVSSNLATATTFMGGRQGGPETNNPFEELTNTNHAGEINSASDFDWSASGLYILDFDDSCCCGCLCCCVFSVAEAA